MASNPQSNLLRVGQLNVRSIRANRDLIRRWETQVNVQVWCFQETWLGPEEELFYPGYTFHRKDRDSHGGGVAVAIRTSIHGTETVLSNVPRGVDAVAVRVLHQGMAIMVISVYIGNQVLDQYAWDSFMFSIPAPFIMCGDFNGHHARWDDMPPNKNGSIIAKYLDLAGDVVLLNSRLSTMVRTTRVSSPDLTLLSSSLCQGTCWTVGPNVHSDHFPLLVTVPVSVKMTDGIVHPRRWNLARSDWAWFGRILDRSEWPLNLTLNEKVKWFTERVFDAAVTSIGWTRVGVANRRARVWWDEACEEARTRRDRLLKVWKRRPDALSRAGYFRGVAALRKAVRFAKRASFSRYCASLRPSSHPREFWTGVRRMTGSARTHPNPVLEEDGRVLSDEEVGVRFATFFARPASTLVNICLNAEPCRDERIDQAFTMMEFEKVTRNLRASSPGPDGLSPVFLSHLPPSAARFLLAIFNESWFSGTVPAAWKTGVIIPILKPGGRPTEVSRYRPITLLSVLGKALDRLVLGRLNWWMLEQNRWAPNQHGGIPGRSVFSAIAALINEIAEAETAGEYLAVEFLDVAQAFDSLDPSSVLREAMFLQMPTRFSQWFRSFLADRTATVRVGSHVTDSFPVAVGVPQGSPLSPTLYNLGTNDFSRSCMGGFRSQFIDDLALGARGASPAQAVGSLQLVNDRVVQWGASRGLLFGSAKSVVVIFGRQPVPDTCPALTLGNEEVPRRSQARYLGIILDDRLNWSCHLDFLKSEISKRGRLLRIIGHYRWGASFCTLRAFYMACIQSRLDFGALFYGAATKARLRQLDGVVRNLLRVVTGLPRSTSLEALYVEAKVRPPELRREQVSVSCAISVEASGFSMCVPRRVGRGARRIAKVLEFYPTWSLLRDHRVWKRETPPVPWWVCPKPNIHEVSDILKGALDQRNECILGEWIRTQEVELTIYTDASVGADGYVAAGFWVPSEGEGWGVELPCRTAITSAEVWGIHMAVSWLSTRRELPRKAAIFCDSLGAISSLAAIQATVFRSPLSDISEMLLLIRDRGCLVLLSWIPSHSAIVGNDVVDGLVSRIRPWRSAVPSFPVATSRAVVAAEIGAVHRRRWRAINTSLSRVRPVLSVPCRLDWNSREIEVTLARARVNRLPTGDNLFRWGQRTTALCEVCRTPDSVDHRLLQCPATGDLRSAFREYVDDDIPLLPLMLGLGTRVTVLPDYLYRRVCGVLRP